MANTALSVIRGYLRTQVGNPSTSDVADSRLTEIINFGHREICARYPFHATRTVGSIATVDGTQAYSLDDTARTLRYVWDDTNDRKLKRKGDKLLATSVEEWSATGQPEYYVHLGASLYLFPTPDDAYTIKYLYKKTPALLSADGDLVTTPPSWDRGLVLYSKYIYWSDYYPDERKANSAFGQWNAWVATHPSETAEEMLDADEAVEIGTLSNIDTRLDFDHSD